MARIEDLIFDNGERLPILMGLDRAPDFWVTLYVTEKLRPSHTQSSITNSIQHLIHLKLWEQINDRDLVEEFRSLKFLADEDIYSIRDHCMLDTKTLKKWCESARTNVVKFASASTTTVAQLKTVSQNHAANCMSQIATFIDFIARVVLKNKLLDKSIIKSIDSMRSKLLSNKPKGHSRGGPWGDPNSKASSPKAFDLIREITREDALDNPFRDPGVRCRNHAVVETVFQTGMRAGEVMGMQIGDIFYEGGFFDRPVIWIARRHGAVEDLRKKQPVPKTRERCIPITKKLIDRLNDYIMNVRSEIDPARIHPYVFVTHKRGKYWGRPISNSTFINRIIKPAIAVYPDLLEGITRHGFRHNFNYLLSKRFDAINKAAKSNSKINSINRKEQIQVRKRLNGWTVDQQSADKGEYNQWAIKETGVDPVQLASMGTSAPSGGNDGKVVRGAARGAVAGVAIGAIAGDAGKGAAIGATAGGIGGVARGRRQNQAEQNVAVQTQQQAALQKYEKAYGACLTGKGYSVK